MKIKKILVGMCIYMFVLGIVFMLSVEKTDRLVHLNWGIQDVKAGER